MDNEMDKQIVGKHLIQTHSEEAAIKKSLARFDNPHDLAESLNTIAVKPTCWAIIAENTQQDPKTFIVSAEETDMFEVRREGKNSAHVSLLGKHFFMLRKKTYHFDKESNDLKNRILVEAREKMMAKKSAPRPAMGPIMPAMVILRPAMGTLAMASTRVSPKATPMVAPKATTIGASKTSTILGPKAKTMLAPRATTMVALPKAQTISWAARAAVKVC